MIGVKFGTKHSFRDFGLILTSKTVSFPKPKTESVTIPGADGQLDLSTALTDGDVKYDNRSLTFKFSVINPQKNWETVKSTLANYLHGQKMNVILDVDKGFYYVGRCTLDSWSESKKLGTLTVKVDAEPYKYSVLESTDDWLWDIFNFESGVIYDLSDIAVSGTKVVTVHSMRMKVVPTITVSANMDVRFKGVQYGLTAGENRNLNIILSEGDNELTFIGTGTVSINFRGGSL